MTSAVGGGGRSPKSRRKEQNQLICDSDMGGGGKIIRNFCGHHIQSGASYLSQGFEDIVVRSSSG